MFVYSVGYYELLRKVLQHTNNKYAIVTSLWKVFSVLLEYCCRADYKMLIAQVAIDHKKEIEELEQGYQETFEKQADQEQKLRKQMDELRLYMNMLEAERNNEKQMRIKLEEEYAQNAINYEEEI